MDIHWFHEIDNDMNGLVGGKGANLGRLTQEGVRVPSGFCVSTGGYEEFVSRTGLITELEGLMAKIDPNDVQSLFGSTQEFQDLFLNAPFPADMREGILRAYDQLGNGAASPGLPVAVRSSSTAEDLQSASFAGQYDSYLNVKGENELVDYIKRCWASLWNPQAINYRHTNGFSHFDSMMAVVVQQMVPSVASGVLFTVNPVNGDLSEMVVNSSWGLGEGVVQGSVRTDSFVLDRVSKAVKERQISVKPNQISYAEGTGIKESVVPEDRQHRSSLSDAQLDELQSLGLAIEEIYESPQDIEWGHDGEKFHILQARSITGLNEFPVFWESEEDKQYVWTLPASREPRPLLPLDESRQRMHYAARMSGLGQIGGAPLANDYRVFNGYPYERSAPFGVPQEEMVRRKQAFRSKLESAWAKGNTAWREYYFPYIDATNKRLKAFDLKDASDHELVQHLQEVLKEAEEYWAIHWMRGGREFRDYWLEVFRELTGIDEEIKALTAPLGPNKSTETIAEITKLAKIMKASAHLSGLFETLPPSELLEALKDDPQAQEFRRDFETFVESYGYKSGAGFGSHSSLSVPTWLDDPGIVLSIISRYIPLDAEHFEADVHSTPTEAFAVIEEAYEAIGDDTQKRERFTRMLDLARMDTADQEDHNFHLDQTIIALLRLPHLEVGDRLTRTDVIESRDDVFFLTSEELQESMEDTEKYDFKYAVRSRKLLHKYRQSLNPPVSLGGDSETSTSVTTEAEVTEDASSISGTPASTGVVTGVARVVPISDVVPDLKPGEILVSFNAGPMWTPLFPIIGGLVLDGGNILLHAALVAREYKIPAVLMTGNGTKLIRDGQTITVDGTNGTVSLHGE